VHKDLSGIILLSKKENFFPFIKKSSRLTREEVDFFFCLSPNSRWFPLFWAVQPLVSVCLQAVRFFAPDVHYSDYGYWKNECLSVDDSPDPPASRHG